MTDTMAALDGIRVLDLGGALSNYCTKLFADLGADVILVEPPEGSSLRHQPPWIAGGGGVRSSAAFEYRNTGKRSVLIDLDQPSGPDTLLALAATADLIVEDHPVGALSARGVGPVELRAVRPQAVVTSITPFGQTGPYAHYPATDLTCLAFSGMLWLGGYHDGPPVRVIGDQAYTAAGTFGAVASMIALTHAELTGEGQYVDVSVQEAASMGLENAAQFYDLEGVVRTRFGGDQREAGVGIFPCADGYVFVMARGVGGDRFWPNLVSWFRHDGLASADQLAEPRWLDRDYARSPAAKERFQTIFNELAGSRSKEELYRSAQQWRVPLGPVSTMNDLVNNPQFAARNFLRELPGSRHGIVPGPPYQLSVTPWHLTGPAPSLGEHTAEVLTECDLAVTG